MVNANQMKAGMIIKMDNVFYQIVSYQHVKPGKGPAYMRTKLKNMDNQAVIERTFRSEEKLELAFFEEKKLIFLYSDDQMCFFMDADSYEQIHLEKDHLKESFDLMKDGQEITATLCEGKILGVELPNFITLKVVSAEGGAKGDTVKNVNQNVRLETGGQIPVPLFIKEGDMIKIDTRTRKYISRV
ncbi:MAG: elongation factor P [Candidatus Omnitrophota bacterium]